VRGYDSASPAHVHEHLLRDGSKHLSVLINDAKQAGDNDVTIAISLRDSAMHRWCTWLYGQPLHKQGEDPTRTVVDICEIYQFSVHGGNDKCANFCIDIIREIIACDYEKLTVDLGTFLHFLAEEPQATQMLVDMLVYGPCARSGKPWEWLGGTRAEQKWVHFFHQLSQAFAKKAVDEASGKEDLHPNVMAPHAYHIKDKENGSCCGFAADVVGDVSTHAIAILQLRMPHTDT
jgi:hypothetical protein